MTTITINGNQVDAKQLRLLGNKLGNLYDEIAINDDDLDLALAFFPLLCEFARAHGERSLAVNLHIELERYKQYKQARTV